LAIFGTTFSESLFGSKSGPATKTRAKASAELKSWSTKSP
jgi:hypothetical protein